MRNVQIAIFSIFLCIPFQNFGQEVSLYQQFNGRYEYTAIGNTLNIFENGAFPTCDILTSSSAVLNLNANHSVVAAYLYWAGSGTGDFDILVNDEPICAERIFSDALDDYRVFFAAFADITQLVQTHGSGDYTISEFDLTDVIATYCSTGTNFGGWAIIVIYDDSNLPLNQLNVYDGLQSVPTNLSITLENLNVLDNENAKIGFIAWEGDASLAVNEQLTINGNVISNPPLNPANNAFNGTNSFTGATTLFNMDIDIYDIQNNINIGDTTATIALTSGQDFVMINNVITVLNSQLPDATIVLDAYRQNCGDDTIEFNYTIFNRNSTEFLPSNTPIAFYINGQLAGQSYTQNDIVIDGFESGTMILTIPDNSIASFEITMIVDDNGAQEGVVTETNEINNQYFEVVDLLPLPEITILPNFLKCNEGFNSAIFNLIDALPDTIDASSIIGFYINLEDLESNENEIFMADDYANNSNPQTIYLKTEGIPCYNIYQFDIMLENCPPHIPEGFSPNNDNLNDWFNIQGLYDIFLNHQLKIFNRYGILVFEGNNTTPWDGKSNRGLNNIGKLLPTGTYYYIINLDDSNYRPIQGWVYMNY